MNLNSHKVKEAQNELIEIVQKLSKHVAMSDIYTDDELNSLVEININLLSMIKSFN